MKKAIIGLSVLVLLSFAVLMFVNAHAVTIRSKKAGNEISAKCPFAGDCAGTAACSKMAGDPAKCAGKECDKASCKEMKCDPANCPKAKSEGCKMQAETKPCCAKSCPAMTAGK